MNANPFSLRSLVGCPPIGRISTVNPLKPTLFVSNPDAPLPGPLQRLGSPPAVCHNCLARRGSNSSFFSPQCWLSPGGPRSPQKRQLFYFPPFSVFFRLACSSRRNHLIFTPFFFFWIFFFGLGPGPRDCCLCVPPFNATGPRNPGLVGGAQSSYQPLFFRFVLKMGFSVSPPGAVKDLSVSGVFVGRFPLF